MDPEEFISIQEKLAAQVDVSQPLYLPDFRTVAGVDVGYRNKGDATGLDSKPLLTETQDP